MGDPEIYVRPDSTAYCTGFPDAPVKVTEHPGKEKVRQESVDRIVSAARGASGKNPKSDGSLAGLGTWSVIWKLPLQERLR